MAAQMGVVIAERIAWESKENSFSRFYQEIPKKNEMKHRQTYTDIQKELRAYTHQEAIEFAANTWVWQRSTNKSLPRQDSKSVVASKSETGTRAYYRVLVDKGHKYVLIACHVNLHGFHRGDLRFVEVNDRTIVKGMDKFCVLGMLYPGDVVAVTKLGKKSKVNTMHPSVMTVHPDSSLIWEVQNMTLLPRIKEERPVNFSILENGTAIVEGYSEAMSVIELKNKPLEMEKIYTGSAFFPEKIKINFTEDFHRKYERPLIAITSKIPSYSNCLATIFSYEYSETQTRLFQIGVFAFNPETFLRYSKEADEAVEKCVRMGAAAAQTVSKGRFDGRGFPMRNIRREGLLLRFSIANPIVMPTDGRWNTNSRISIEGIHGTINAIMETIVLDDNKRSIHIAARLPKDYSNNTDFRGVWIVHQLPSRDDVKLKDKFFRDLRENWNGRRVIETLYGGPPMVLTNNQLNLDAIYLFPSNPEVALNRYQNYYVSMILADVPMVLGNSPFGCGKSMTIVTAAIEVHKRNSKYNNHGKQRQQLLVTQTNNAGASLIHIACKVVNVNVKFLRYISEINWDVLPDSSRTIYDMPILMKDLFVRWATRTLENTTKFDKLAVNLKTAIVRKVTQDYIRPEMLDGEAKRIYQNLADVATYTEPSARTLREAFFNVYEPDIIVTTADSLPRLLSCDVLKCVSNIQIDEASQLPEHTLIFLLQRFVHAGYGLVGDIKQLPPHCGKELTGWLKEYGIGNTMERALNSGMFPQSILRIVYRCHPVTTNLLSDLFYDGNLISGVEENDRNEFMRRRPDIWPNPHFPILVLNQDEKGHRMGTSVANDAEKLHVWRIVRCLTQMFNGYQLDESDVGIISFYRAQTSILTEAFRGTGVKCGTVDAFQGTEKEVIIVCCTNEKPSDFMTLGNRLNVAMSRARQATIIIGNVKGLRNAKYWKTIVEKARMNSCLKEIEQFGNTADFYHDALSSFSSSRDNYDDDDDSNDPDYSAFSREAQLAWTGVGNVLESDEEIIWSTATQEEMNGADSWGQQTPQVSLAPIVDQFNDTRISASASSSSSNTQDNEEGMVRGERRHRGSFEII